MTSGRPPLSVFDYSVCVCVCANQHNYSLKQTTLHCLWTNELMRLQSEGKEGVGGVVGWGGEQFHHPLSTAGHRGK